MLYARNAVPQRIAEIAGRIIMNGYGAQIILGTILAVALFAALPPTRAGADAKSPSIYDFTMTNIDGKSVKLSQYRGDVVMVVNTASLCGNTPQYADLETLYEQYKGQGLRILAFPANNFAQQEPGPNGQIKEFCTGKYHVTFDLFSKISVKGDDQDPLYKYLTDKSTDPQFGGDIEWNFAKFLISRDGTIINRFPAGHKPLLPDVVDAVKAALAQPNP
jgi:glutathione peroxidase